MDIPPQVISSIVQPVVTTLVTTLINPLIEKWKKNNKNQLNKELDEYVFGNKFEEYFERVYEKYSYLNTIVFENRPVKLKDLYIPLTVQNIIFKELTEIKIEEYDNIFIPSSKKVLLKDSAGMGKSTLLKFLFISCIENSKAIPIFIELKKLSGDKSIFDIVCSELSSLKDKVFEDLIHDLINKGEFVFFFDGFDEIPQKSVDKVSEFLSDFIDRANKNLFIVSSRPETGLSIFSGFEDFTIQPLERQEAFELIRKYDKNGELSETLIKELEDSKVKELNSFLENPLLVSLLYRSYDYKRIVPQKKTIFYRQVYDALFDMHDLTKGGYIREKHSKLDLDSFHSVLRAIGFFSKAKTLFSKDEVLKIIKEAKDFTKIDFNESKLLKDLTSTVPLFTVDGDYYGWSHKSIQDYFIAQFIYLDSKEKQKEILLAMAKKSSQYFNILDLYYEIDEKEFDKVITYHLASKFVEYCETTYNDADNFYIKDIRLRQSLNFGKVLIFAKKSFIIHKHKIELFTPYIKNEELKIPIMYELDKIDLNHNYNLLNIEYPKSSNQETGIMLAFIFSYFHHIIKLLVSRKKYDLFTKYRFNQPSNFDDWHLIQELHVINDDDNFELNKAENFSEINNLLFNHIRLDEGHFLDLEKCKKFTKQIDDENMKANSSDNLISSI